MIITKDMLIGEIVESHPEVAEIFMEYGLACVGCHIAFWETIEEGAMGHGMDPETIDCMVRDANEVLEDKQELLITDAALAWIKSQREKQNKQGYVFEIKEDAKNKTFTFEFKRDIQDDELVIEKQEVLIGISKDCYKAIQGKIIDVNEKGIFVRVTNV